MARFEKPDRTPPSERVETGIPEREGPPPDSGEEGARLDDAQESDNPGIDSPTRRADDDDDPFSKPDRRGPSERRRQRVVADAIEGVDEADIRSVDVSDGQIQDVTFTESARVRQARQQFAEQRDRARATADVDDPTVSRLGAFDPSELTFQQRSDGRFRVTPTERASGSRSPAQSARSESAETRAQLRARAAEQFGVAESAVEIEEQGGELIARAEVEQEPDRPLADRFEAATGIEVPTQRELFSTPRAAAGRAGSTLRELGIPTSTGGVRGGIERQLGIEFPDSEAEFLSPATERADEAVGFVDFDELPTDSDEFSAALERETGVDIPSQREVVNPIRSTAIDAGSAVADFDRNFAPDAPEFGLERSGGEPRFDRGDVADFGRGSVETAIEINDRFTVPGYQGFGTVDPNVDENEPSGPPDLRGAAVAGVAAPEPATSVGGAAILGGLFLGGIAFDTVRRRGELGIGDGSTEVQEVEIGETDLAEIEPTEQARGTQEVGLGSGVGATEVDLGDFVTGTEIEVGQSAEDEPTGGATDDSVVPAEFPLPGRDVPRDPTRDRRAQVDPSEFVGGADTATAAVGGTAIIDQPDIGPLSPFDEIAPDIDDGTGGIFEPQRRFPTGGSAVVGRESGRLEVAQTPEVTPTDADIGFVESLISGTPRDPIGPGAVGVGGPTSGFEFGPEIGVGTGAGVGTDFGSETEFAEGTATQTEIVTQTATANITDAILEEGVGLESNLEVQPEAVEVIEPTLTTTRPPRRPRRRRREFEGDVAGEAPDVEVAFDDAVFENPTQGLVEADAELADLGEGFDAP